MGKIKLQVKLKLAGESQLQASQADILKGKAAGWLFCRGLEMFWKYSIF
ncbi:MAG: hypothetical protein IIA17_09250 [candidate division Zixibacteria bacterium]|nr:hypothetical protein [candidate division Zixibacteria bacterium]